MGLTTLHLTNAYHPRPAASARSIRAARGGGTARAVASCSLCPGRTSTMERGWSSFGRIYCVRNAAAPAFDRRYRIILPHQYLPLPARARGASSRESVPTSSRSATSIRCRISPRCSAKGGILGCRRPVLVGLSCERFDDNMAAYCRERPRRARSRAGISATSTARRSTPTSPKSEYTAAELRAALHDRPPRLHPRLSPMACARRRVRPERRAPHASSRVCSPCRRQTAQHAAVLCRPDLAGEEHRAACCETLRLLAAGSRRATIVSCSPATARVSGLRRAGDEGALERAVAGCAAI